MTAVRLGLVVASIMGLLACSGGAEVTPGPAVEPAPAPAPPEPVAAPVNVSMPAGGIDDASVLAAFRGLIDACNTWSVQVGNTPAGQLYFDGGPTDPTRSVKVAERKSATLYVIEDADGGRLLLDTAANTIASQDGPTVPLPIRYSFCPTEKFLGPMHD